MADARRVGVWWVVALGGTALGAVAAARLAVGPLGIDALREPAVFRVRVTSVVIAAIVGAALAISGAILQTMVRNVLASPWILGLSSGAGLGITVELYLRHRLSGTIEVSPSGLSPLFALSGAAGALAVVYTLARHRGVLDPTGLVLIGVVISVTCGAASMFVQNLLPDAGLAASVRWTMGRIDDHASDWVLVGGAAIVACGLAAALLSARSLDAMSFSDDEAVSLGIDVGRVRRRMFIIAAALSAAAVVIAGPIGFVGLVCPHAVRLVAGPRHVTLLVGSALLGAAALVTADLGTALVTTPTGRMPVGVVTAIIGGPLFIVLLRGSLERRRGAGGEGA